MNRIGSLRIFAVASLFCLLANLASGQDPLVSAKTYVQYPSLTPVTAVVINIGQFGTDTYSVVEDTISKNKDWNCSSPSFYKVAVVDVKDKNKILRTLEIRAINLPDRDRSGRPLTKCDGRGHPARIDLILGSQVSSSENLRVFMYADTNQKEQVFASDGKLNFTATPFPSFTATPQAAPNEALTNGDKRDVGQLNVEFADQNLLQNKIGDFYVKSSDLFSTDSMDSKSAFAVTGGFQRGLLGSWYSPYHFEEKIQGNQTASNLSATTGFGFSTLPSWHWTGKWLVNGFIYAPLPFEPAITAEYNHRINQLVTKKISRLSDDDFSLNPSISWSNISFPFVCKLLRVSRKSDSTSVGLPDDGQPPRCLGTELDLGLWYLPLDLTKLGNQRAEGYGDVSILIPLSDFAFASTALSYVTKGDPMKFQLRIKYADSVNAANNYARARQWTFGIEVLK